MLSAIVIVVNKLAITNLENQQQKFIAVMDLEGKYSLVILTNHVCGDLKLFVAI